MAYHPLWICLTGNLTNSCWIWDNWGEPEGAPHRRVCRGICLYILYTVRHAVSHFCLLFCEFLRHSLFAVEPKASALAAVVFTQNGALATVARCKWRISRTSTERLHRHHQTMWLSTSTREKNTEFNEKLILLPHAHAQGVKWYLEVLSIVFLSVCCLQKKFQISYKQILLRLTIVS